MNIGFVLALVALVIDIVFAIIGRVPLIEGGLIGLVAASRLL